MGERILTAGQPSRVQLEGLATRNIGVVIHLAVGEPRARVEDEPLVVQRQGLRYVRLDIDPDNLTAGDLGRFSVVLADSGDRYVLVHCERNALAATFVFLYRVIERREDVRWAQADLEQAVAISGALRRFVEAQLARIGVSLESRV
jgi:hypothetical protein